MNKDLKVSIYQPVYFPWLGFFHKLVLSDVHVVLDDCQAIKQSWMNRVKVKSHSEGKWLTVPILTKHRSTQLVKDIEINYNCNWVRKHLSTIKQNYSKAPYFEEVYELMQATLSAKHKFLIDLNIASITRMNELMGITTKMVYSSELHYEKSQSTQRLIEIIKSVNGKKYICGMGSDGYLMPDLFANNNLCIQFQNYKTLPYPQLGRGDFIGGLSIIDTFTNIGFKGVQKLLSENSKFNQ